jgi:ABC-2 type transport system permease protein
MISGDKILTDTATTVALEDLTSGWEKRRLWLTLARDDIRVRYKRTVLGQLWITMGFGFFVAAIGMLWSEIMHRDIVVFVPWFAIGITTWHFITAAINEGTTTFIGASSTIHNIPLPLSLHIFRAITRHFLNYLHNFIIVIVALVLFPSPASAAMLLYLPGMFIIILAATATNIVLGILGARYRDLSHGVRMLMMPMFFITPILWVPDMLSGSRAWLAQLNPFTHFIAIVREPLLGRVPELLNYAVSLSLTLCFVLLALRLLGNYRWKVPYWIS